ncbi:DUF998 domain-containing protein [Streptomyces sp. SID6041]|nr:DUF998 domain-containing protein [Streptomyces sp. SID6041]
MPGNVMRASAALLALGAFSYTAWALEAFLRTGLDPVRSYVSELASSDQPFGTFFRATDLLAGALVLAGAVLGRAATRAPGPAAPWRRRPPRPDGETVRAGRVREPWALIGWGALALFGAATVADSRLPLSCAATVDPACAAREAAGLVPATHTAHAVSSGLAMTCALVALVALTVAARRHRPRRPLARTGLVVVALELAATVWTLAAVAAFEAGRGSWALGAGQRLQVLLVAVWLAVLAYSLATSPPAPEPERQR